MTNLLMLRGMIASTYRTINALYRRFDLRRCDLHHRLANFSRRLVSCDLDGVPVRPPKRRLSPVSCR
jgi:hypothetical protein